MHWYNVTLQNDRLGQKTTLKASEDHSILDAAKEMGLNLPLPCRTGMCDACVGKLLIGDLDQTEQSLLDDAQIAEGGVLLCRAYALSDCTIAIDWEGGVLEQNYPFIAIGS
ncbi:ferredoxin [Leptolyngbyaceae cyanobacterium CCMR0082]|uniref:Ferredoxin n=3 Tax=Adonisia TaxID=2950183 RepID=A0A6M0S1E0_9CYAN|nr:2Fe-2S iron-sulfur cluster-binding protein [Adonisia turfae]MDV3349025.1 2Fe-2S iron-sulfur cluster-binding protein [Leptothoe sp. LEGE 181152]NEZ58063.1 ferredoxin [Adonisia turfae CCMR0081]NEZ62050.1 ferredoxin [Adonisia turfae CCMR0082]